MGHRYSPAERSLNLSNMYNDPSELSALLPVPALYPVTYCHTLSRAALMLSHTNCHMQH